MRQNMTNKKLRCEKNHSAATVSLNLLLQFDFESHLNQSLGTEANLAEKSELT